jgi:ribosome maturation factor RimP
LSRNVGERIEEANLISNAYVLEVSSPGLDYPLQSLRQYKKNIGRTLKVVLENDKIIKGKLLNVTEEGIKVGDEKKSKVKGKAPEITELEINFKEIKKTNVLASFK